MTRHARFFRVWFHRYPDSIFGAASSPVIRNGAFLCFDNKERAQAECDRLNAQRNDMQVRYSVEPSHIDVALAQGAPKPAPAVAPSFLAPAWLPITGSATRRMPAAPAVGKGDASRDAGTPRLKRHVAKIGGQ